MFKIGDEVLVVSPPDSCDELVGEVGIVIETEDAEVHLPFFVKFKRDKPYIQKWWCEEESLQLFQPVLENI